MMYELHSTSTVFLYLASSFLVAGLFGARRTASDSEGEDAESRLKARVKELETERRDLGKHLEATLLCVERLHSVKRLRDIPDIVRNFIKVLFEPDEALVLIRRRAAIAETDRERQLIAASVIGSQVRRGTVVRLKNGFLSRAATEGILFENPQPQGARAEIEGFRPDFAVPMPIDGEIVGVLTASGVKRTPFRGLGLLQLVARTAAKTYKSSTTLNRVRSEADIDALTGILNKGALTQLLEEFAGDAKKYGRPLSVFLFDIDNFKNYNDTNGHLAGDDCLRMVSRLVADRVRADDAFGRWGGEEFLLLLPGRDPQEAGFVAEDIRRRVVEFAFPHAEKQPLGFLSISGGVACLPDHAVDPNGVVEAADRALYRAKKAGRNQVDQARRASEPASVAVLPDLPATEDDLQRIDGVGPKFAERMQTVGIFSYQQIAELDWRGMVRLADALGTTPERIVREQWLAQARDLARESQPTNP